MFFHSNSSNGKSYDGPNIYFVTPQHTLCLTEVISISAMTNSKAQTYATTRLDDLNNELSNLGLKVGDDGYVHWKKGSLHHPRNWSGWRKAYDTSLIVFLDFFTYVGCIEAFVPGHS